MRSLGRPWIEKKRQVCAGKQKDGEKRAFACQTFHISTSKTEKKQNKRAIMKIVTNDNSTDRREPKYWSKEAKIQTLLKVFRKLWFFALLAKNSCKIDKSYHKMSLNGKASHQLVQKLWHFWAYWMARTQICILCRKECQKLKISAVTSPKKSLPKNWDMVDREPALCLSKNELNREKKLGEN